MATWRELSIDNREAAKDLLIDGRYRSSISRAYYAAYCAVSSVLEGVVDFTYGGNNPSHESLDNMIVNNLYDFSQRERFAIRKGVRKLRNMRVAADYVPTDPIVRETALEALRTMSSVLKIVLGEMQ